MKGVLNTSQELPEYTHSTVLLHAGGLLIVMNTQFDRIVIMMNMLNNLISGLRKHTWTQICAGKHTSPRHFTRRPNLNKFTGSGNSSSKDMNV